MHCSIVAVAFATPRGFLFCLNWWASFPNVYVSWCCASVEITTWILENLSYIYMKMHGLYLHYSDTLLTPLLTSSIILIRWLFISQTLVYSISIRNLTCKLKICWYDDVFTVCRTYAEIYMYLHFLTNSYTIVLYYYVMNNVSSLQCDYVLTLNVCFRMQ